VSKFSCLPHRILVPVSGAKPELPVNHRIIGQKC